MIPYYPLKFREQPSKSQYVLKDHNQQQIKLTRDNNTSIIKNNSSTDSLLRSYHNYQGWKSQQIIISPTRVIKWQDSKKKTKQKVILMRNKQDLNSKNEQFLFRMNKVFQKYVKQIQQITQINNRLLKQNRDLKRCLIQYQQN